MEYKDKVEKIHNDLHKGANDPNDFVGWLELPTNYDKKEFARIKKAIDRLTHEPQQIGSKLTDPLSKYWRVRVGDYRVIYTIQNEIVTVTVVYAGHRKEVYKRLRGFLKR